MNVASCVLLRLLCGWVQCQSRTQSSFCSPQIWTSNYRTYWNAIRTTATLDELSQRQTTLRAFHLYKPTPTVNSTPRPSKFPRTTSTWPTEDLPTILLGCA